MTGESEPQANQVRGKVVRMWKWFGHNGTTPDQISASIGSDEDEVAGPQNAIRRQRIQVGRELEMTKIQRLVLNVRNT
jgi:hypothetical protein